MRSDLLPDPATTAATTPPTLELRGRPGRWLDGYRREDPEFWEMTGRPIADGQGDRRVVMCPPHHNAFERDTGCWTSGEEPLRNCRVTADAQRHVVLHTG